MKTADACTGNQACEMMKPKFEPTNEWKDLLNRAGGTGETMSKDKYLEVAKQQFPDNANKMDRWVKQIET